MKIWGILDELGIGVPKDIAIAGFDETYDQRQLSLADDLLPHLLWPFFARNSESKIAAHKMLWPS